MIAGAAISAADSICAYDALVIIHDTYSLTCRCRLLVPSTVKVHSTHLIAYLDVSVRYE